ncbi:tripartite tricarboxylate transporter substrate binding protein [Robertmurraya yapensis]|uniref:Tripartite tricarboxylate transporter substrate binding protein n=1 Tax=Bacillus yapensis TaxID=2492960 RepID=A0A431WID3_9BACI|nr:tripartite tricarboxylate transporter substrate binding protein [Bacillus yapensis]RTR35175.1 tripartite tricarboxylate transporter substrate binding protein [Bacillus yapensis]TKS97684.1 tripartite tricarboxylate transporter substrate binding protein [Bacillus yapensis]
MGKKCSILVITFLLLATVLVACSSSTKTNENSNQSGGEKNTSDYPNRPITFVVPFSAGGSGDIMTREVAKLAEKEFGQTIIVENKEGGSGAIALNYALSKPADGYTILNHSSTLPLTMASGEIPFEAKDIQPVATMVSNYQVLAVPKDSPFITFQDFVEYAKNNPGKLNVVSSQTYGTTHIFSLKIMEEADINFNYIAYDGGSEALTRILGGNGDAITSSGEVVQQQVESGDLRLLGVSSAERLPTHPDVPTFKELGITSIDDELIWRAYFVRPGTPEEIVEKITEVLRKVSETPEFKEYAKNTNQDIYFKTGEELTEVFNNYYEDGKELFESIKK